MIVVEPGDVAEALEKENDCPILRDLFSDTAGLQPILTSDNVNGFGIVSLVNLDGTVTTTNNLLVTQNAVPEPDQLLLFMVGLSVLLVRFKNEAV